MMNKNLRYIILTLLLLLTAGVGESVADVNSELTDSWFVDIKSDAVETLSTGVWYVIKAEGNSDNMEYLCDQSLNLVNKTNNISAETAASYLFQAVAATGGGYYIMSGNGKYLRMDVTSSNGNRTCTPSWVDSQNNATAINYTFSRDVTDRWGTTTTTTYKCISSFSTLYNGSKNSYYGLLSSSNKKLTGTTSTNNYPSSNTQATQFTFSTVELEKRYYVTYNFVYNNIVQGSVKELVASGSNYPWTTIDAITQVMEDSLATSIVEAYELDAFSTELTTKLAGTVTTTTSVDIPLKERVTLLDQPLEYATVSIYEDEVKDLNNYITKKIDSPTITYTLIDGGDYIDLTSAGVVTGKGGGTAHVKASAAATSVYKAVEVEIPIKVTGYTDAQKAFIAAYDALAAYKDNIGIRLGQYTYKKSSTSTNDNAEFTDMIFDYINQRNDVRSYTDRDLQSATTAITALTSDLSGKLSLNLPTPGTLLRMKASGSTNYIAPTPPTGSTYTDILYYYDPSSKTTKTTTVGSLVSYDTGYHVQSMAVATTIGDGTDYTFTAMTPTATDGLYKANDLTTSYILEDVDSLPVIIREYGYATLYTPAALQIPNAIKAYIATAQSGTNITLSRIRGIVPSGTALVLVGAAGTYQFPVDRTSTDVAPTSPLKGTYPVITTASVGSSVYALQPYTANGASTYSNVAFYPYSGTGKEYITHFKCYFTSPASAKLFTVTFDDNGIDSIEQLSVPVFCDQSQNSAIYDLQGRRITTPAAALPRGIYIIGGRKVVIK